jgi:2-C-methyl-D-erythritol 4-phosphate cytidylyltransferase
MSVPTEQSGDAEPLRDCAAAVVVAAGSGTRMGLGNKALLPLADAPLLAWTMSQLREVPAVAQIVLVMGEADRDAFRERWQEDVEALGADLVVAGGAERWLSSRAGVQASDPALPLVLVHDAARPLTLATDIQRVAEAAHAHGAALLASPLADTLKEADANGDVLRTVPRTGLWRAATPQGARRELLLEAFDAWPLEGPLPTDEASLLEAAGHAPRLVDGGATAFKITTVEDLFLAEKLLQGTDDA